MKRFFLSIVISCSFVGVSYSADKVDFSHDIVPILRKHCIECHGGNKAEGGFSLNTRKSFLEGEMAIPGNAVKSEFLILIADTDVDVQMPPQEKPRVSAKEVTLLRNWVNEGMAWEAGFTFASNRYEPPLEPRKPILPPANSGRTNPVDRILDDWIKKNNVIRPKPISDAVFLRRVYLDLVGLIPDEETTRIFLEDQSKDKRKVLVKKLLADDLAYTEHWLTFWNDLLRNDYTGTGFITKGRTQITGWLYDALMHNKPFDQFTRELIAPPTAKSEGYINGIKWRGTVSAGQTVEIQFAQSISQSFLGINMKCASCHDSFIDRWTLKEAYGLAAVYAKEPLELHRCDKPIGEKAKAAWLFPELGQIDPEAKKEDRLKQLANLMTHPRNGRFTRTIVNRLWAQLMGRGIVHPLDAMQTAPWNTDLLDYLAVHLQENRYDLKKTLELIATSAAYQSRATSIQDESTIAPYNGPRSKRLTAEQFVDAVWQITGTQKPIFDADVIRGKPNPEELETLRISPTWIWGELPEDSMQIPGGQKIAFSHVFKIDKPVRSAGIVMTCDDEFTLYLNSRLISKDNNWTTLESYSVRPSSLSKTNRLIVVGKNGGKTPNPAGMFLALRVVYMDGTEEIVQTNSDWTFSAKVPKSPKIAKWGINKLPWAPVTVVEDLFWQPQIQPQIAVKLATSSAGTTRMVRSSIVKSDFLMRSLGRPNRDQIVTSRPNTLTTLEAIELYNNPDFAAYLQKGSQQLAEKSFDSNQALVDHLFLSILTRFPTKSEKQILSSALGTKPSTEEIQDVLWAILMMPEFILIR